VGVAVLEISPYSPTGLPLDLRQLPNPTWEQVESSIRRQDGYTHPLTRLRLDPHEEEPALDILGGSGRFVLWELGGEWQFHDPSATGGEELPVWTSDQGYLALPCQICCDIERVVRIARRFFDTGSFVSLDSIAEPRATPDRGGAG
jgi:hypothetical protein